MSNYTQCQWHVLTDYNRVSWFRIDPLAFVYFVSSGVLSIYYIWVCVVSDECVCVHVYVNDYFCCHLLGVTSAGASSCGLKDALARVAEARISDRLHTVVPAIVPRGESRGRRWRERKILNSQPAWKVNHSSRILKLAKIPVVRSAKYD